MSDAHIDALDAITAPSRPRDDMELAREVGPLISHMLGDGRSVIDPAATIWTPSR